MPSPKDGKGGRLVVPAVPREALDADKADPGAVEAVKAEQRTAGTGKYGSKPVTPFKPVDENANTGASGAAAPDQPVPKHWIAITLVDLEGEPMPGEPYRITLPDGQLVAEGTLDENGHARVEGIEPGTCKVTFPRRDARSWKSA